MCVIFLFLFGSRSEKSEQACKPSEFYHHHTYRNIAVLGLSMWRLHFQLSDFDTFRAELLDQGVFDPSIHRPEWKDHHLTE